VWQYEGKEKGEVKVAGWDGRRFERASEKRKEL